MRPHTNLDLSARATRSSEVLFQELDGEGVLLNLESERYFGLDTVGTRVWELLGDDGRLRAVYEALTAEFEVDAAQLATDLIEFVTQLAAAGLVTVEGGVRP